MLIRDRIKELRRVPANQLKPHPKNWRRHGEHQRNALQGILAEVGYADALLARELDDGSLELIDGHLRAETTPNQQVPVLILDVNQEEAAKILATHDPLGALAETEHEKLDRLLEEIQTDNDALQTLLDDLGKSAEEEIAKTVANEVQVPESFQVVVECDDESQQMSVYQQMTDEGYKCRVLTL